MAKSNASLPGLMQRPVQYINQQAIISFVNTWMRSCRFGLKRPCTRGRQYALLLAKMTGAGLTEAGQPVLVLKPPPTKRQGA